MKLTCTVNGNPVTLDVDPEAKLLDVIRDQLGLTGTKLRCREGHCGLCMVIINGRPLKSCLIPMKKVENATITTIEGIGTPQKPHPLQKAFVDKGAIQCGYCTPAFIVSAYALLQQNPKPSREQIVKAINPVICRCTGYEQIIEAIEAVVRGEYSTA